MKYILVVFLVLATVSNVKAIDKNEFIKLLKSSHSFFKQQYLSQQIKQKDKQIASTNANWNIDVNAKHYELQDDTTTNFYTDLMSFSAVKKYTGTGSNIVLNNTWNRLNTGVNDSVNKFSVNYTRPLLRDKNGINDRLNIDLADIDIQINNLSNKEQEEVFILDKLKKFIDLVYAQQKLLINENRFSLAEKELKLTNDKFKASVAHKVEVLLQEDVYQKTKQQLLQAEQDLSIARYEIATILGIDVNDVSAEFDLFAKHQIDDKDIKELLANIRELQILALNKDRLERQLASYKNKSKAKINFNFGASSEGRGASYANSLTNQDDFSWNVGVDMSYRFGINVDEVNVDKIELSLINLLEQKQDKLNNIYTQANIIKEKIKHLYEILQSDKLRINIANKRTAEQRDRYLNGNGQAEFVINAQNNEQNIQLSYIQNAVNYQKFVLEFRAVIDELID